MLVEALAALAAAGRNALVSAMVTDGWERVKGRFARLLGRGTAGDIYTMAGNGIFGCSGDGGLATRARLAFPQGVAEDRAGNLVIADTGNARVRVVAG